MTASAASAAEAMTAVPMRWWVAWQTQTPDAAAPIARWDIDPVPDRPGWAALVAVIDAPVDQYTNGRTPKAANDRARARILRALRRYYPDAELRWCDMTSADFVPTARFSLETARPAVQRAARLPAAPSNAT